MADNDKQFDRRTVLKALGSTATVGAGLGAVSGSAAAIETKRRLTRAYADESRLRAAFQEHAQGLRETLVENGFAGSEFDLGTVEFTVDDEVSGLEPSARDQLAGVTAIGVDGTFTALGMASTSSATHEIALFVQPERGDAYALVEPKAGDTRFVVTESGVSPTGCKGTDCGYCCDPEYRTEREWECNSDCTDCWVVSSSCTCGDLGC